MLMTTISPAMVSVLRFVPAYVLFRPWTLITYMFLHAGLGHIFFNMLGLFFFGPRLEIELGGNKFLGLYFTSGVMGALLSSLFSFYTPIIGASGAVYGVMLGFAYYWPREKIYIYAILPVEARYLVIFMTIFSMVSGISGSTDGIAHFAHLGGFLGGYLFLRFFGTTPGFVKPVAQPKGVRVGERDVARWSSINRDALHPVNRDELDRIMNKISSNGADSLEQREVEFLDRISSG
jgi:membrane associated rhomboid family serine protease